MSRMRLALAVAASALCAAGCGQSGGTPRHEAARTATTRTGSAASTQTPAGSALTRAQMTARANAICLRLNAKRSSILIRRRQDYERYVPELAAYELGGAVEMSRLTPPRSMAGDWRQIVAGSRTIAEVTGRYRTFAEASNEKLVHQQDELLGEAIDQVVKAAKHAGLKECAHFK